MPARWRNAIVAVALLGGCASDTTADTSSTSNASVASDVPAPSSTSSTSLSTATSLPAATSPVTTSASSSVTTSATSSVTTGTVGAPASTATSVDSSPDCADPTSMPLPEDWDRWGYDILAVRDLDGNGVDEIVAGWGNTAQVVEIAVVADCRLLVATTPEPTEADGLLGMIRYGFHGNAALGMWGDVVCDETPGGQVEVVAVVTEAVFERSDDVATDVDAFSRWERGERPVRVSARRWRLAGTDLVAVGEDLIGRWTFDTSPWPTDNEVHC